MAASGIPVSPSLQAALRKMPITGPLHVYSANELPPSQWSAQSAIFREAVLLNILSQNVVVSGKSAAMEIYEFLDPAGAYCFLLGQASAEPLVNDVDCRVESAAVWCWRQNYVLRLSLKPTASKARVDTLLQTGHLWAEAIGEPVSPPVLLGHLPKESLVAGSIRYELGPAGLGRHVDFTLLKEFGMDKDVQAAVADYARDGARGRLVLLGYPTVALARQYAESLRRFIMTYPASAGVKRAGVIVAVATGLPPEMTRAVLERVQYAPSIKWLYKKEDDATFLRKLAEREAARLMGTVVSAILFTVLFCGLTAFGGLAVGMTRYWVNERYPNRRNRLERIQMIQLHLDR